MSCGELELEDREPLAAGKRATPPAAQEIRTPRQRLGKAYRSYTAKLQETTRDEGWTDGTQDRPPATAGSSLWGATKLFFRLFVRVFSRSDARGTSRHGLGRQSNLSLAEKDRDSSTASLSSQGVEERNEESPLRLHLRPTRGDLKAARIATCRSAGAARNSQKKD